MTRDKFVKEIRKILGDNFIVSEPRADGQPSEYDNDINYVIVRIDKLNSIITKRR